MSLSLDQSFAVPAAALKVHSERTRLLAENIANADTPHYKARDVDFRSVLRTVGDAGAGLEMTDSRHLPASGAGTVGNPTVQYRIPANPSLDGNTVEVQREQAAFAESALSYRAALTLLGDRIQGLIGAIRGE